MKRPPKPPTYADAPELFTLGLLAEALNQVTSGWRVDAGARGGPLLLGTRDNAAVFLTPGRCGDTTPGHIELAISVGLGDPERAATIPDCVSVPGPDVPTSLWRAAQTWADTTATAVLTSRGARTPMGAHFGPDEEFGVPGWHVVTGGVAGYSAGPEEAMKEWLFNQPPWPLVARAFGDDLDPARPHPVKVFIGAGNGRVIAEVQLDGEFHEGASEALGTADWPRVAESSVGRCFAMFVPPRGAGMCMCCGRLVEEGP